MIRNADAATRAPLWHALGLDEASGVVVLATVGAGGKTSLLYALAREVADLGGRAIVTGTTRFTPAPHGWPMPPVIEARPGQAASLVVGQPGSVLVVTGTEPQPAGRLAPLAAEDIDALAGLEGFDVVLVEADGSRARPFKAPGDREPVIPASATHVVATVGASVLGSSFDGGRVHRPEIVRILAPGTEVVDASLVARVLAHVDGGRKGVGARQFTVVVNQADTHAVEADAIARAVRASGVARVIVTALRDIERPLR
ncbi:MAG: putative selenium-dependent hydroxylase accessory protein YqeC [Dehalococcoidia bacterium]|nr:MAG: putative selenium-dependent hydroxylase accessory protein YqeC [Dehalococcoidia bacterium]